MNGIIRTYIWGVDMSGSLQGAGGVGGLLAIKPTGMNTLFVASDGNGNVTGLIDATTGTTAGQFDYGPFGETIRLTPNSNNQTPFRFSTKYADDESDFLYFGFRYYNTSSGRWLSRDPVGEVGSETCTRLWVTILLTAPTIWVLLSWNSDQKDNISSMGHGELIRAVVTNQVFKTPPAAWFWHSAMEKGGCSGGLCNSGDAPEHQNSSFVTASVKNTSTCT